MWRVKLSLGVLVLFAFVSAVILCRGSSSAAVSRQDAATVHLAFSDTKHLAVDIKTLSDAYNSACNPFLELIRDPVVISELLIGKPSVTFIRKDGDRVEMTGEKVKRLFTGQVRAEVE